MQITPRSYIKTLTLIHSALMIGPFLLGTFFFLNTEIISTAEQDGNAMFIYVFPLIGLIGIFGGKFLYKLFLNPLLSKETLGKKLTGLQSALLIQYALLEGPALLNIIWFGQSGNTLFLTVGGVLLLYLFVLRPKSSKIESDLQLQGEHKRQFHNLDEPLA